MGRAENRARNRRILIDVANGHSLREVAEKHNISESRSASIWSETLRRISPGLFVAICSRSGNGVFQLRQFRDEVLAAVARDCPEAMAEVESGYERKRNALIKHAVATANMECGSRCPAGMDEDEQEEYIDEWNRIYHGEMHRLAREAGLQGW